MKVKKTYTKTEVLDAVRVGYEFELYSSLDVFETARDIGAFLKKRVVVPLSLSSISEPKPLYHSPVAPTDKIFKLEPDYSGGKKMCELVTGPMSYKEAKSLIVKVFEWINDNGYTNDRCSVHVNMSIDGTKIPTKYTIQNLNIPKFILSFDEGKVYDVFPKRKDSVYARSIKQLHMNKILFYSPSLEEFSRATLSIPDEKYYGVNFLKAEKGYLEYRYMGGTDYQKKGRAILDLIDYFALHLYDTLNFEGFTEREKEAFRKMTSVSNRVYEGFVKYEEFAKNFPDVRVTVDMNNDPQVITTYWGNIREKLYSLIVVGGMKKGNFNYDTELGRYQLQKTKLKNCRASNIEFIECDIEGVVSDSWMYNCDIKHSRLNDCDMVKGNKILSSKVSECELHVSNTCEDCYIEAKKKIINCEVKKGIIRNGEIGKLAKISKETLIVEGVPTETNNAAAGQFADAKQDEKNKKKDEDRKK